MHYIAKILSIIMQGQISEDGQFMWDGANWVPNTATQGGMEQQPVVQQPVVQQPMVQQPAVQQIVVASVGGYGTGTWKIQMADSGLQMFFLSIGCFLINCFTLFLAVPWTTVMYYNAWSANVDIDGRSLRFTGNAGSFLMVWLKTLVLSVITLGIYYILIGRKNVKRWVDSNLSWA